MGEEQVSPLQKVANQLHRMSIVMGLTAIIQMILWAVRDHHSFDTEAYKLAFIIPLCTIGLAFVCHYTSTTPRWLLGVLAMCINIAIFGLQVASIVLAIRHHNSVVSIVIAFLSLIIRVALALFIIKFIVVARKYGSSSSPEYHAMMGRGGPH